jgi:riboflavin synthase|tara:strand:+ start:162 stop:752 length:591 start_codon:yes stop_codon:yes gene_type:complete
MFNGIIFNQGLVKKITKRKSGINFFLKTNLKITKKDIGISVSCDGVCLTLINIKKKLMEFYLSKETIKRSKFKNIIVGNYINLELPLKYGRNISGHFIQGHVDCTAKVSLIKKIDKSFLFNFIIKKKDKKYLVEKASIGINGISLTISKLTKKGFQSWVIPHTLKLTNFSEIKKNDLVNIEIDILSKYVKKYVNAK